MCQTGCIFFNKCIKDDTILLLRVKDNTILLLFSQELPVHVIGKLIAIAVAYRYFLFIIKHYAALVDFRNVMKTDDVRFVDAHEIL